MTGEPYGYTGGNPVDDVDPSGEAAGTGCLNTSLSHDPFPESNFPGEQTYVDGAFPLVLRLFSQYLEQNPAAYGRFTALISRVTINGEESIQIFTSKSGLPKALLNELEDAPAPVEVHRIIGLPADQSHAEMAAEDFREEYGNSLTVHDAITTNPVCSPDCSAAITNFVDNGEEISAGSNGYGFGQVLDSDVVSGLRTQFGISRNFQAISAEAFQEFDVLGEGEGEAGGDA